MIGWWTKNGGRYVCADRYPRHQPWACDGRSVMAREVEGPVWEYVKELLSDPELLKARYEEGRGDPAVDSEEEREKECIGRKLKALDREVGRLIDAYQAEVIDLVELTERRERIGRQTAQRPPRRARRHLVGSETGSSWREMPEEYGKWETAYRRHELWSKKGLWRRILRALGEEDLPGPATKKRN